MSERTAVNIVFRRSDDTPDLVFVEIEDDDGRSIRIGEWSQRGEYDVLRLSEWSERDAQ